MLTAITREVSLNLGNCLLTFLRSQPIDVEKAIHQHRAYQECLARLGLSIISLPSQSHLPDSVFVEDTAVVVDELAVVVPMGAEPRTREPETLAPVLAAFRPLQSFKQPARLEGGDVIRIGRTLYVGVSTRTNREGIAELKAILEPHNYEIRPVQVNGCLHLSTGCSYLGKNTMLANKSWVDTSALESFDVIAVDEIGEPMASNTIVVGDVVLMSRSFPRTYAALERRGFQLTTVDISEFEKAEAGPSCMSLIFNTKIPAGKSY